MRSRPIQSVMDGLADGLGAVSTLFMVAMVLAGVMKLFQIHTTLMEIKESLQNGARPAVAVAPIVHAGPVSQPTYAAMPPVGTAPVAPVVQAPAATASLYSMGSGEEMLRALDAQMKAEELDARTPEVVEKPRF